MVRAHWRYGFVAVGFLAGLASALIASGVRADLFVSSDGLGTVLQYDENTGNFITDFVGGGVGGARGVLIGPDGNLYAASSSHNSILRYDPTGSLVDIFVTGGTELSGPRGIIFGPDGNLYVSSKNTSSVVRYNGTSGLLMDTFVHAGSGGLNGPRGLVFGPDGNLYVASFGDVSGAMSAAVLRYNGNTGAFMDIFATDSASNSTNGINGLTFGPDGNLYVTKGSSDTIIRYNGSTGQQIDYFVQGNGIPGDPNGILFGPDGNLYVGDLTHGGVIRFDGTTGDLIDLFVDPTTSGNVTYMTFSKTDPVTLNYKP